MSKRQGETVGHIQCPWCLSEAEIRQTPGKAYMYIGCTAPGCAVTQNRGQAYQDYIQDRGKFIIEGEYQEIPEDAPGQALESAPVAAPESAPVKTLDAAPEVVTASGFWPWED